MLQYLINFYYTFSTDCSDSGGNLIVVRLFASIAQHTDGLSSPSDSLDAWVVLLLFLLFFFCYLSIFLSTLQIT